jgi:DNA-binding response OmpR family regulator
MGAPHRSGQVLVIADNFLIAINNKAVLAELGFRDVYIQHKLEYLRSLLSSRYLELGLLDINIGSELVYPLAAELCIRHIPIIFLTGRAPSEVPLKWLSHPILSKPLTKNMLRVALGSLGF